MDTTNNFQTSFIPKKPLAEERVVAPRHTSLFSFIATIIFFLSLAGAAGIYFYKASLESSVATMKSEIVAASDSFQPSALKELQILDRRLTDANHLLSNHIAVSPI